MQFLYYNIALNSLESTPAHINGQLSACVGEQMSFTCNRDFGLESLSTRWIVSSPTIPCDSLINHLSPISIQPCDAFMFQDVTEVAGSQPVINLSNTAIATANASMSGAVVQCSTSKIPQVSRQVGLNITLCIPGKSIHTSITYITIKF